MNVPAELKYTDSHEWVRAEPDGTLTIASPTTRKRRSAISSSSSCGGRPQARGGRSLRRRRVGEAASGISTLAVSNSTFASNTALADAPEKVNADAYGNWLYRLKPSDAGGLGGLLDAAAYTKLIGSA